MNCIKLSALSTLALTSILLIGCAKDYGAKDYAAGQQAMSLRDYKTAVAKFEKAAKKAQTNVDAYVQLATASVQLGDFTKADAAAKAALALDPASVPALLLDGQIAYQLKDLDRAGRDYETVANDASSEAAVRANAYNCLGVLAMTRNDADAARLAFYRGLRLNRRDAQVWYNLGRLYRDNYHFDGEALEQFEFFVRLADPSDERVENVSKAIIPDLRASIAKDVADLAGSAAKRDPGKSAKALAAANAALKKVHTKVAIQNYTAALAADPLSFPAAFGLARTLEASEKTVAGLTRALNTYKTAARLQPASMASYIGAARLSLRLRHAAEASAILDRALAHDPANTTVLDMLATAYAQQGRNDVAEAYRAYRAALKK